MHNRPRAAASGQPADPEGPLLSRLHWWLRNAGPDKQLLGEALTLLPRHEAAVPDPANAIKVQFLIDRDSDGPSLPVIPAGTYKLIVDDTSETDSLFDLVGPGVKLVTVWPTIAGPKLKEVMLGVKASL